MNHATQSFLGRYRLVKVLGQGAMGVVYEAVDTRLNRTVAIKTVLRSHLADESTASEYASRFEREAQAAARLAHPNVVTVYDFGEHEDISYIVMEFVRGRELNQAFEAGESFALPETIRIMRELLAALNYAHEQGIVHRDIKPANVMLDHAGRVKLTDFGVARIVNANQDRTMPGTLVGTPSYMSPEQILGLAVGSRADIFAAGVILYQFLTGKRPFAGGGPFGVQRKIVQDDPDPPSVVNPQLPPAFDLVIARALAKQPEQRYETAAAFAQDLERIAATLPRDGLHLDLDFSDPAPPPPEPSSAAPRVAPAAAGHLTLRTDLPAAQPAPVRPASAAAVPARGDPEATVVVRRAPPAPPAPAPSRAPAPAPAAAPTASAAGAAVRAKPLAAPPAAAAAPAPPRPSAAPAPRPMPPTRAAATVPRRPWGPMVAGAAVAALALAGWALLSGSPSRTAATAGAPAAAPPAAEPPVPVATTAPAVASPAVAPPAEAPAAPTSPAPAPPAETPAAPPPTRPAADAARRATDERIRPAPPVAPAARPTPVDRPEPRGSTLDARCSDLLQRMQLGEPLTPEQTQVFQTRCTR
jgi:serine/threonine-protein kinase